MTVPSHSFQPVRVSRQIAGRTLTLETGRLAKQADGAVFAEYGETALLATAQSANARPDIDFFPLTVEYREKTYAAGKVPGGFFKREMRPRDNEILVARSIDRPVRPMFAKTYRNEVQIIVNVLSFDRENEPDCLAGCAAMAALTISSIPYQGPGATVRVGRVNDEFVLNPTYQQLAESTLDLMVSGNKSAVTMVEAGAMELPDDLMADAIMFGHRGIVEICGMIEELAAKVGKPKQEVLEPEPNPFGPQVERWRSQLAAAMDTPGKHAKKDAVKAVTAAAAEELLAAAGGHVTDERELKRLERQLAEALHDLEGDVERRRIVEHARRADGRGLEEIRPIDIELGVLHRTHGSALFTRGETQALVTVTLGTGRDEQIVDGLQDEFSKRFMLHYNFPPFCVGEVRRMMGTSRREIGHGHLAERAVALMMPSPEEFPYSARVVSEILESNGSSSMASVCGASLSLLDAGCPLRAPVAGIAMGLIEDGDRHYVLSDILGSEDHNGDMDFKVAGTRTGVTALQMDIKIQGLSVELLKRALEQARRGRLQILDTMAAAITEARPEVSRWAPQLILKQIPVDKIGGLIGPGGKIIRGLQTEYNVRIEVSDEGVVTIAGGPGSRLEEAVAQIEAITGDAEVGQTYRGKVVSLREFGAFIEIFPGKEGLLHISDASADFVKNIHDLFKVGDEVEVVCTNVDEMGRVRLAVPETAEAAMQAGGGRRDRDGGGGRRGRESGPKEMPELGKSYTGTVKTLKPYGAFIEVLPGTDGLCHVSEMAEGRVGRPEDVVSVGDQVRVKVLEIEEGGRIRLSMRRADTEDGGGEGEHEAIGAGGPPPHRSDDRDDAGRRRRRRRPGREAHGRD